MNTENLNFENIMSARRAGVEKSIRVISAEELKALAKSLFPYEGHPWQEPYQQFIAENAGSTFYHAKADDQIQVIYCPAKGKGIWFKPDGGLGIMQENGLKLMKEIVEARR